MLTIWHVVESEDWYEAPPLPQIEHWYGNIGVLPYHNDKLPILAGGVVHSSHLFEYTALLEIHANTA